MLARWRGEFETWKKEAGEPLEPGNIKPHGKKFELAVNLGLRGLLRKCSPANIMRAQLEGLLPQDPGNALTGRVATAAAGARMRGRGSEAPLKIHAAPLSELVPAVPAVSRH